jgi:hypothetical protein
MANPLYFQSGRLVRNRPGVWLSAINIAARIGPIEGIWQSSLVALCFLLSASSRCCDWADAEVLPAVLLGFPGWHAGPAARLAQSALLPALVSPPAPPPSATAPAPSTLALTRTYKRSAKNGVKNSELGCDEESRARLFSCQADSGLPEEVRSKLQLVPRKASTTPPSRRRPQRRIEQR